MPEIWSDGVLHMGVLIPIIAVKLWAKQAGMHKKRQDAVMGGCQSLYIRCNRRVNQIASWVYVFLAVALISGSFGS